MKKRLLLLLVLFGCDDSARMTAVNHRQVATPCSPTAPTPGPVPSDNCLVDSDCPNGGVCSCAGNTFGYAHVTHNLCVPANCHVDANCAGGASCSPTVSADCGSFYGVQGYYCHSAVDACTDDSQCDGGPSNRGYCAYSPQVGHWVCSHSFCAG
jgi:hypothetical protein